MVDWFVGWLVDWLIGWWVGRLVGWWLMVDLLSTTGA
jgi:hypothetical protein